MKKLNKKGFTLIELLAVIVILGILMLIAVPAVTKYINSSRKNAFKDNAISLIDAVRNDTALSGQSGCYAEIGDIKLEKGSTDGLEGYVYVGTEEGAERYKITIKDTKNGYYYDGKTEDYINNNDPATSGSVTALADSDARCTLQ